jgi:hypothetical protein
MGLFDRKASRFDLNLNATPARTSHHQSPADPDFDREAAGAAAADAHDATLRGNTGMAQRLQNQADRHRDTYLHPYSH